MPNQRLTFYIRHLRYKLRAASLIRPLAESAFEQIRSYAKTDVAVSLRLLRALTDISTTLPGGADRRLLADHGRRLLAGFIESPGEDVLVEMKSRLVSLEKLAYSQVLTD